MDDLISRQAAMTLPYLPKEYREYITNNLDDAYEKGWDDCQECIKHIPADYTTWIPVSERLPDNEAGEDWVVAVVREKDTGFCWIPRVMEYRARLNDWLFQNDNGWLSYERNKNFEVVAWMPLPEPYKEGADE